MSASRRRLRGPSTPSDDPIVTRHQRFIRSLPCLSCGKPAPSECASIGRLPGLGILPSDRYFVPLCGPETIWEDCCHSRKHYRGAVRFWLELGIDPVDVAVQLWRVSGDVAAGRRTVMRARQATIAVYQRRNGREPKRRLPRSGPDGRAAFRHRLWPTGMALRPTSSEFEWFFESRS